MELGKLSYRFTPVYVAISFALAVPHVQANSAIVKTHSDCSLPIAHGQINFSFNDRYHDDALDPYRIAKWDVGSVVANNAIDSCLGNVNFKHNLTPIASEPFRLDSGESLFVINGNQRNNFAAPNKSAINLTANKVIVKTTGGETNGAYYLDSSRLAGSQNESQFTAAVADSGSAKHTEMTYVGAYSDRLGNESKVETGMSSIQTKKAIGENAGMVTIYSSGESVGQSGLSSLVYSKMSSPVTISSNTISSVESDIYSRFAANDNIHVQNSATIIGQYDLNGQSEYVSNLTISPQEKIHSLGALSNAAKINKSTALKTLQTKQATTDGIIAVQNLNYIIANGNKASATRLLDKFSNLEKPGAIQVGYQIKNAIVSGLEKSTSYPDGMINIRADQNSIGKRLELRGSYIVNNVSSYVDTSAKDDGAKMTGNVTIYDANSTKVYVNNTTIYFEGDRAVSAIDVVDVDKNSVGLGPLERSHIISASQYKLYSGAQITNGGANGVTLVGFTPGSLAKNPSAIKGKIGA